MLWGFWRGWGSGDFVAGYSTKMLLFVGVLQKCLYMFCCKQKCFIGEKFVSHLL
jgi:hypothetical protein